MKKFFNIKFNDFICPDCGQKLYIPDIVKALRIQYEPNMDANGYLSLINVKCECGNRYKLYLECHEYNDSVTVVIKKIARLANWGKKNDSNG